MFDKNTEVGDHVKNYRQYLSKLLAALDCVEIENVINCFYEARKRSSAIFFAGNGGSAATASHFAQDLAEVGRKTGKLIFKTQSLADNIPSLTALANDYGYENIFKYQLEGCFKDKDVLVVISASGNSSNIVKAVETVKRLGGITVALVGFDGGKLAKICDHVLHIKTQSGEYGPVEDLHLILDHIIVTYLICNESQK